MAQAKYITVAELAEAYDNRLLQQLGADSGSLGTVNEANTILLNAIERGSADVESKALKGGRYTATDLLALQTADDWILKGLVAALAMVHLFRRRGGDMPADVRADARDARDRLKQLESGSAIFNDSDAISAGKPSIEIISAADRSRSDLASDSEFFPQRKVRKV